MTPLDRAREALKDADKLVKRLEKEEKKLLQQSPEAQLAIALHGALCHHNHTDGCGWYYAIKDGLPTWEEYSQQEYLKRAHNLLNKTGLPVQKLIVVVQNLW